MNKLHVWKDLYSNVYKKLHLYDSDALDTLVT